MSSFFNRPLKYLTASPATATAAGPAAVHHLFSLLRLHQLLFSPHLTDKYSIIDDM